MSCLVVLGSKKKASMALSIPKCFNDARVRAVTTEPFRLRPWPSLSSDCAPRLISSSTAMVTTSPKSSDGTAISQCPTSPPACSTSNAELSVPSASKRAPSSYAKSPLSSSLSGGNGLLKLLRLANLEGTSGGELSNNSCSPNLSSKLAAANLASFGFLFVSNKSPHALIVE